MRSVALDGVHREDRNFFGRHANAEQVVAHRGVDGENLIGVANEEPLEELRVKALDPAESARGRVDRRHVVDRQDDRRAVASRHAPGGWQKAKVVDHHRLGREAGALHDSRQPEVRGKVEERLRELERRLPANAPQITAALVVALVRPGNR